jgi:mannose-6-phosphate isomerase-like protein (cupin superfamily)
MRKGMSRKIQTGGEQMASGNEVRRVVTTVDQTGAAVVLLDGDNPHKRPRSKHGTESQLLWVTDHAPAAIGGTADRAAVTIGIAPPPAGSIFRIVDFHPIPPEVADLDPNYQQQIIGDQPPGKGRAPRHPLMHRTRSVDYAIVMQGEIDMLLDEGEIHLKAGDVLIQQGTNHAWVNRGSEPCRIAFVLIDAAEP